MGANESILAIDIGVSSLKIAEFERTPEGIAMKAFGFQEYEETVTDDNRNEVLAKTLEKVTSETTFESKKAYVSISGQLAFSRFVKLPPVEGDEAKVRQIVEFEAKQNVPFEMDDVIWDYQLIEGTSEEMDVIFVVIKNEIVEAITDALETVGIVTEVVDIAPSASYNAARANKIGENECSMVLSIGARCSNLVFVEGGKFFCRNIPIAGHTITQQIAKEFGIGNEEAEELKRRHGFVALGGAYEEPESEVAATISKIVRNVMTRLHGEVSRSINIYRSQQKGNKPSRLYLAGGSSIMPYTELFFQEKLKVEVEYLNPFQFVKLAKDIDRQELQDRAHLLSEVIGIALRKFSTCPVEINLIPEKIIKQRDFGTKKPFLLSAAAVAVVIPMVFFLANIKIGRESGERVKSLTPKVTSMESLKKKIDRSQASLAEVDAKAAELRLLVKKRKEWVDTIAQITGQLPDGVVITELKPISGDLKEEVKKKTKKSSPFAKLKSFKSKKAATEKETASENQYGGFEITCIGVVDSKEGVQNPLSDKLLENLIINTDLFLDEKSIPIGWDKSRDFANLTKFAIRVGLVKPLGRQKGVK